MEDPNLTALVLVAIFLLLQDKIQDKVKALETLWFVQRNMSPAESAEYLSDPDNGWEIRRNQVVWTLRAVIHHGFWASVMFLIIRTFLAL